MAVNRLKLIQYQHGQATTEYILLISIIAFMFLTLTSWIQKFDLAQKLLIPLNGPFASAYQYGHTKAKGYENGGPQYHPRIDAGGTNFRLFILTTPK